MLELYLLSMPGSSVALAEMQDSASPHRDLRNNVISTVQPGAFQGLWELRRL